MFSKMNLEAKSPLVFPVHEYPVQIKERHLDTFGHVNNAQYLILFEEARWETITSRGHGLKYVHETQIGTVVLECTIRFRRELHLRETIVICTQVKEVSSRTITLSQRMIKENGKLGAEATFTMGCFDLPTRKLISPTPEWLAAITGLNA
jgi:YbgC/YbaW family acyl-CoA thioester hydrolase